MSVSVLRSENKPGTLSCPETAKGNGRNETVSEGMEGIRCSVELRGRVPLQPSEVEGAIQSID
jgi:hypothetical protein